MQQPASRIHPSKTTLHNDFVFFIFILFFSCMAAHLHKLARVFNVFILFNFFKRCILVFMFYYIYIYLSGLHRVFNENVKNLGGYIGNIIGLGG